MALEKVPEFGSRKPVSLTVRLPALKGQGGAGGLGDGMRELYRRNELTDVSLVCAGSHFPAHRAVLAARSEVFKHGLAAAHAAAAAGGGAEARQEVRLAEIENPEAARFMLDYMYDMDASVWEDYNPRTQAVNRDVLRLAQNFNLPGLKERATHWLAKDITTGNVVERLAICEDFGCDDLRERILEQLCLNKRALADVANSPQIVTYPRLMQTLLQHAAQIPDDAPAPKKKGRRC